MAQEHEQTRERLRRRGPCPTSRESVPPPGRSVPSLGTDRTAARAAVSLCHSLTPHTHTHTHLKGEREKRKKKICARVYAWYSRLKVHAGSGASNKYPNAVQEREKERERDIDTLMLLPLEGLAQQREQPRGRHQRQLLAETCSRQSRCKY